MGFNNINEEQKVRISLSKNALSTIYEDMNVFRESKHTTFINTIIHNFKDSSIASVSVYLSNKKIEYSNIFENTALDENSKNLAVEKLLSYEKEQLKKEISHYLSSFEESKVIHINNKNAEYLRYDCNEEEFYNHRIGLFIKCLLEDYASHPFIEREKIYRKEVFEIVERACTTHSLLKIRTTINNEVKRTYIYPYKILPDPMNTQYYLACYSRFEEESVKEKKDASFSMARLPMPVMLNQSAFLSKNDIEIIENDIASLSVAFLLGEKKEIHVKLTEQGKLTYNIKLFSRPTLEQQLSSENDFVFICSENQAFFYFYSFGADAEILSPHSLRNRIIESHKQALDIYQT